MFRFWRCLVACREFYALSEYIYFFKHKIFYILTRYKNSEKISFLPKYRSVEGVSFLHIESSTFINYQISDVLEEIYIILIKNYNVVSMGLKNLKIKMSLLPFLETTGANRGDTIQKFFDGKLIDMKDFNSVKWIIHAFEPNPTFNEKLIETKKKFSPEKTEILLNLKTAAWIKNGKMDLYFDGSTNSEGTSLFKNHPAVKKDGSITSDFDF
ncbi:hypothetical protein BpHYR1_003268 [Brachionus plicatilis]|uniref:Uncharacterized protein n=1 Tax=Brachionus plicatilis TaxID=10195 RepID=A0A3M7RAC3_BRAPC|nr:hypothetical protein BpHYR1_003268 [Brachionus plicatilis]